MAITDRVAALRDAAQARHSATLRRANDALRALSSRGETVTYTRLAQTANVSRSWLYNQELRAEIDRHRQSINTNRQSRQGQPATTESLRQQLHTYRQEIARLRAENRTLNDQLARHLGTRRTENITRRHPDVEDMSTT